MELTTLHAQTLTTVHAVSLGLNSKQKEAENCDGHSAQA